MLRMRIGRCGIDARKREAIKFIYTVDAEVRDEEEVHKRPKNDARVSGSPDMRYRCAATANATSDPSRNAAFPRP